MGNVFPASFFESNKKSQNTIYKIGSVTMWISHEEKNKDPWSKLKQCFIHFVIPKLHHMWSTRFCVLALFINHQIMFRFLCTKFSLWERECDKFKREREYGFQSSQENSHVQEPTTASFNQILKFGDYSEASLSSLFECHFLLIQFLE